MKRSIALLLALLLVTAYAAAIAQVPADSQKVVCEALQYSTLAPEDAAVYADGESMFIDLNPVNGIPYVEIDKVLGQRYDTGRYFNEILMNDMQSRYGDNLRGTSVMEYYTVGGKDLPAAQFTYKVGEYTVYFLQALELNGNDTVFYTAKFLSEYREETLNALDMAVRCYQPDAHYYDGAQPPVNEPVPPQTSPAPQPAPVTGAVAVSFEHVRYEDMRLALCAAPAGYSITPYPDICGEIRSFTAPLGLTVIAKSPDGRISMVYESPSAYLEIVSSTKGGRPFRTQENGGYDTMTMTPMAQFPQPNAYAYAYLTGMYPGTEITYIGSKDLSAYQPLFQKNAEEKYNALRAGHPELLGLNIDSVSVNGDICAFSGEVNGEPYFFVVGTVIEATQTTSTMALLEGTLKEEEILWSPLCTYVLSCPVAEFDSVYPAFEIFMENTTVSDQFIATNQRLSDELRQIIVDSRMPSGYKYSRAALSTATGSDETYDDERFTDYIFDQNDYTLSDGSHVKVSTAYDYVYEGDNGVVYFSDSAFPQPGTQLTPNR